MPRFVLLLHECPNDRPRATHCDLMLEDHGSLRTWSLRQLPKDWSGLKRAVLLPEFASSNIVDAERLPDHRPAYLDYEGPVSGDRGSVQRLDSGAFTTGNEASTFILAGRILRGGISFTQPVSGQLNWKMAYHPATPVRD